MLLYDSTPEVPLTDRDLAVAAWNELVATTETYATWVNEGRPSSSHWARAKALVDAIDVVTPPPVAPPGPAGWTLVWSDEFDGDLSKWNVRDNTTSNNQLAEYMARNAVVAGGVLTLAAKQEAVGGKQYTSAYLDTIGKFSIQYGRWEMRALLPQAQGMWPAFWLRGNTGLGEIDIVEAVGGLPQMTVQTLWQSTNGDQGKVGHDYELPAGTSTTADWHVYAFERKPGSAAFYVDDVLVQSKTVAEVPWLDTAYNEPMNIRLNLQVGGSMPNYYKKPVVGAPVGSSGFMVDYVRVYQPAA